MFVEQALIGDTVRDSARPSRTRIFIVCSPRPRVGRTLLARLLVEFFKLQGRPALAFDANPDEPVLSHYLPDTAVPASMSNTFGEVALFDRLIEKDGRAKIVDLAHGLFNPFFDLAWEVGFVDEARAIGIDVVALFAAEDHPNSAEAFRRLRGRFPAMTVVPVYNEAIATYGLDEFPGIDAGERPLHITELSPHLKGITERPGFSFADYAHKHAGAPTSLHAWITRAFIGFRDLELRLMLEDFRPLFATA